MRRARPKPERGKGAGRPAPATAADRVETLLDRLATEGPSPRKAAEELDRLQARMARDGRLEELRGRVARLCEAWRQAPLRGERAEAWLTLVGGFGQREHAEGVAALAADPGAPAPVRLHACRVLAALDPEQAVGVLESVLLSPGDAQVRACAAEALGELREASLRPVLEALLEEELPRPVWVAVTGALSRLP